MKKKFLIPIVALALAANVACNKDEDNDNTSNSNDNPDTNYVVGTFNPAFQIKQTKAFDEDKLESTQEWLWSNGMLSAITGDDETLDIQYDDKKRQTAIVEKVNGNTIGQYSFQYNGDALASYKYEQEDMMMYKCNTTYNGNRIASAIYTDIAQEKANEILNTCFSESSYSIQNTISKLNVDYFWKDADVSKTTTSMNYRREGTVGAFLDQIDWETVDFNAILQTLNVPTMISSMLDKETIIELVQTYVSLYGDKDAVVDVQSTKTMSYLYDNYDNPLYGLWRGGLLDCDPILSKHNIQNVTMEESIIANINAQLPTAEEVEQLPVTQYLLKTALQYLLSSSYCQDGALKTELSTTAPKQVQTFTNTYDNSGRITSMTFEETKVGYTY